MHITITELLTVCVTNQPGVGKGMLVRTATLDPKVQCQSGTRGEKL